MELAGVTWVVAADHSHARLFEERQRGGSLHELPGFALNGVEAVEHPHGQATVYQRAGFGRSGSEERSGPTEEERRFARALADRLEGASRSGAFDQLALFAPARTLGLIQHALPRPLARKVAVTEPRFCVREDAPKLRERLQAARSHP